MTVIIHIKSKNQQNFSCGACYAHETVQNEDQYHHNMCLSRCIFCFLHCHSFQPVVSDEAWEGAATAAAGALASGRPGVAGGSSQVESSLSRH